MVHINELYPPSMLKPLLPYKVICDNRLKEKEIEDIRKDPRLKEDLNFQDVTVNPEQFYPL